MVTYFNFVYCIINYNRYVCRRLRSVKPEDQKYDLNLDSLQVNEHSLEVILKNAKAAAANFKLTLTALEGDTFRVLIDEENSLFPRYIVHESLAAEPQIVGYVVEIYRCI